MNTFKVTRQHRWLGGILFLALALRVWDLGARSLWFDEASEYWVATAPLSQIAHFVGVGSGDPPLYSFLLHFWMKLGTNEIWLRLLSVFASLAGVAGAMALGLRLGGLRVAGAAGLLFAVNPPDIRYAQEAGQYALMLGTLAWNLVALHGLWSEGGRKWVLAWALTAFLATTSYYAAAFTVGVPVGCALVEAAARRDGPRLRRFAPALALFLVVAVPVLWTTLPDQLARVLDTRALMADYPQPRPEGLALVWRWICNLFAFHFAGWPYTLVPAWITVASWLALLALALRARPRWTLWFGATWAVYGIASRLELFPFGFRWGLILLPSTVVLAAIGAALGANTRALKPIGVLAFAGLMVGGLVSVPNRTVRDALASGHSLLWPETEDVRPVAEYWHQRRTRSQPTYVFYGAAPAFAYYLQRYPDTRSALPPTWSLSCWHDESPPAFCRNGDIYYGRWLRSLATPEDKVRSLAHAFPKQPRELWIVFSHVSGREDAETVEVLKQSGYTVADWIERRNASAVLLVLP
jgi:hypothetical protein